MAKFGFGHSIDDHVFSDLFDSVDEVIGFAEQVWKDRDKDYFYDDKHSIITVWYVRELDISEFVPDIDDIAGRIEEMFYDECPLEYELKVEIVDRDAAKADWRAFVGKYFRLPCKYVSDGEVGRYDLKAHKWIKEDE